jgi:hypothetical protein
MDKRATKESLSLSLPFLGSTKKLIWAIKGAGEIQSNFISLEIEKGNKTGGIKFVQEVSVSM